MMPSQKILSGVAQAILNRFNSTWHSFLVRHYIAENLKELPNARSQQKWSRRRGSNPHGLAATGF
jgi:hypothetical protein